MEFDSPEKEHCYVNLETTRIAQELMDNPNGRVLLDVNKGLSPDDMKIVITLINGLKAKNGKLHRHYQ